MVLEFLITILKKTTKQKTPISTVLEEGVCLLHLHETGWKMERSCLLHLI